MASTKKAPDKIVKLYGGKVKIEYYDQFHRYIVNHKKAIGVTTATGLIDKSRVLIWWATKLAEAHLKDLLKINRVLNEADIEYACKLHMQRKTEAADLGTQVHAWAEEYINALVTERGEIALPEDDRVLNGVLAFLKWVKAHKVEFVASEQVVYSLKHEYVGTLDCIFTMGKEDHKVLHIGDFKTSSGIYDEMIFQVTAYEEAEKEESGKEYGDKYILRFDKKTGEFDAHRISAKDHDQDFNAFVGLLTAKKRLIEMEEKSKK